MPKRDKLFLLVKSLSKSEKRYFSIYTKMHIKGDDNDYMKLFKAFEKQDVLNENEIRKQLEGEKLIAHYAVTKSYLYDLILKAMRSYSKHSADKKVMDLLQDVEFLYTKGIFDQAIQLIKKARELALGNGLVAAMDLILHWEKVIHLASGFTYMPEDRLPAIDMLQDKVHDNRDKQHHLWMLCAGMAIRQRKGLYSPEELGKEMEDRLTQPETGVDSALNNSRVHFLDLYARTLHTSFGENPAHSLEWLNKIIRFMEEDAARWQRHPYLFARAFGDRLELQIDLEQFDNARKSLEFLQSDSPFREHNSYFDAWSQFVLIHARMLIHFQNDSPREGIRFQPEVRSILKKFTPFISLLRELEFNFMLGYFHFRTEAWFEAEGYFSEIISEADDTIPSHLISAAWLMRIACLLHMDNRKRAVKLAEKFAAYLQNSEQSNDTEKQLLPLLNLITEQSGNPDLPTTIQDYIQKHAGNFFTLPVRVGNRRYFNRCIELLINNRIF